MIVVVNGFVVGGGVSLVMVCDFWIVVFEVWMWILEVCFGVLYMWGFIICLINFVGMVKVKEFVMMCDELDVEEVLDVGFVN